MRPASMYSSTDSFGMLRSRSALTARSRSFGAIALARATSSAAVGIACFARMFMSVHRRDRRRDLLGQHDGWNVGVAAWHGRHDRAIDDAQTIETAHAAGAVHHRVAVGGGPHPARAGDM